MLVATKRQAIGYTGRAYTALSPSHDHFPDDFERGTRITDESLPHVHHSRCEVSSNPAIFITIPANATEISLVL